MLFRSRRFWGATHAIQTAQIYRKEDIKTDEGVAAVLRPKTIGIEVLDEVTRREPIRDFIVFFSLAGVIGNFGQADYAADNAYVFRRSNTPSVRVQA